MASPPPLPPNRPTPKPRVSQQSNSVAGSWSSHSHQEAPPPPRAGRPNHTLSPRHSWAGTDSTFRNDLLAANDIPLPRERSPLPSLPTSNPPSTRERSPFDPSTRPLPPSPPPAEFDDDSAIFPDEEEKFTLTELVDNYSSIFPIKVTVVKGYYGDRGEDCAIAVDELYYFHFVKRSKVVSITDVGKNKYVVPLNSSAKFGIQYEHGIMVYGTVEELMAAKPLPRVVSVGTGYVGNTPESSVHRHEVLIVKKADRGNKLRRRPASLKVFSLTKNIEKSLGKEVYGKFTTDPFCTQMYLPEYLKHVPDPIPTQARLYLDFESGDPLPDFLTTESVTIQRLYVETSIIATLLSEEDLQENTYISSRDSETVDIPISLAIEVSVIPPVEDDDYEKLTYDTMNLLTHFDPSSTTTHPAMKEDDENNEAAAAQNHLFKSVRKGFEKEGLNIETPTKIRSLSLMVQERKDMEGQRSSSESYEDMTQLQEAGSSIPSEGLPPPPLPQPYQLCSPRGSIATPPSPPQRPLHTLSDENEPSELPTNASTSEPSQDPALKSPRGKVPYLIRQKSASNGDSLGATPPLVAKHPSTAPSKVSKSPSTAPPPVAKHPSFRKQNPNSASTESESSEQDGYSTAREGITLSHRLKLPKPPSFPGISETQLHDDSTDNTYDTCDSVGYNSCNTSGLEAVTTTLNTLLERVKSLEERVPSSGPDSSTLLSQVEKAVSLTKRLERDLQGLQQGMEELRVRVEGLDEGVGGKMAEESQTCANAELAMLDMEQIQKMLEAIGLAKYQQVFGEAGVDGDILVQCDDIILKEDLSVSSRLDRIKLLQVISGKRSVSSIFQKSYVAFQPRT